MAQEKKNVNNVNIPDQISWTQNQTGQAYRGTTMVTSRLQGDALNYKAQTFGKREAQSDTFSSLSRDITGGAIDISLGGSKIQPMGSQIKQSQPLIEVIADQPQTTKSEPQTAPFYDGFQPHYAHYSNTLNPMQMHQTLQSILSVLEQSGAIDFYAKSPFIYAGRAFGSYNDCEFLLSIFAKAQSMGQCIVEIRRSSGESFEYANVENNILKALIVNGAIIQESEDGHQEDECPDEEESDYEFGFCSLPSLDSMDLDSNTDMDEFDDDDHKSSFYHANRMDVAKATQLLRDAVDLESMRDVLRSDIAHLNEQMSKNEDIFQAVPDIIATIVSAINDEFYDCWGIKMYLGMISKLISVSTPIPSSLLSSIEHIKTKWCHIVVNQVAPGVQFEFYPSQQIVRCCNQIMDQLQSK
eukprot:101790_1